MKINLRTRHILLEILLFTVLWMIIMNMYFLIAYWGIRSFLSDPYIVELFNIFYGFDDIIFHSLTFGLLFSVINITFDRSRFRKLPVGKIILLKSVLYIIAIIFSDTMVMLVNAQFNQIDMGQMFRLFMKEIPVSFVITTSIYYTFFILLLNFLYQVNKRIGPGILFNSILGKYHQPRDEKLIFMFIDMKNSTGIAEKLEHKKYSMFIKDCFSMLTNPIYNCRADVYQFVGDEAVLTWSKKKGLEDLNCLKIFFEFRRVLEANRAYFMETYGIFPEFKAGVDYGEVTVTEVGEIRRDLAYHGDVLNTAARLEKLCKKTGHDLLITEYLEEALPGLNGFETIPVEGYTLEGKEHPVRIFAVKEKI
jgi:adenylate cyclase